MIPIGTLCILINDGKLPPIRGELLGTTCRVVGYDVPACLQTLGLSVVIGRDDWPDPRYTRLTNLLPIEPDQTIEQREKEIAA